MTPRHRVLLLSLVAGLAILWPGLVRTQTRADMRRPEHISGRPVAEGEVLVRLRTDTASARAQLRRDVDADDDRAIGSDGWRRVHSASRGAQDLLTTLSSRADVLAVEPNYIVQTTAIPNDPDFSLMWGLQNLAHPGADIHATAAWDVLTGSTFNVVGMVDTGVDYTHPDLAANMWSAPAPFTVTVGGLSLTCAAGTHGFNAIAFAANNTVAACNPMDDNGHGTHTAGTVGAVGNNGVGVVGVNWTTRLMGMKFLDATGSGTVADAVNAIDFALQTKAAFASGNLANVRVLSNSWGGTGFSSALASAIDRAAASDVLFVAAAGNSGSNNDASPFYPASYTEANVVAVAATDSTDSLAGFSNYGATSVDLAAPGVNILSTWPGGQYAYLSGTSMATPHVAGAAMLMLSACAQTTAQLKNLILNAVDVIPSLNGLVVSNGRLNVDRAIRSCATFPQVTLTSPADGSIYTAPATITLTANASDVDGIGRVEFYQGSVLIGSSTSSPYSAIWSGVPGGAYLITAKAYNTFGVATTSVPSHITVTGGIGNHAAFLATDATTQGNWQGVYGADGYNVINDTVSYPAYATVAATGESSWTWAASTSDVRALQKATGTDRVAATWYAGAFNIDINFTDGAPHTLAVYAVDWDSTGRVERFEVHDAVNNALLDSQPASGFHGGQYWRWTISGHVTLQVIGVTGDNAVVSGLFFGGGNGNVAPSVTLTTPVEGASYSAPATIAVAANASDSNGIDRVEFYETPAQGQPTMIGQPVTTSPYQLTWSNVAAGSYTLTAKAFDKLGASGTSTPIHVTVTSSSGTSATFLGTDTTTQGNWRGVYGADGYNVINDTVTYPAYATVAATGQSSWTWAASTADVRGLQRATGTDRLAATWYGNTWTIDVNVLDGASHTLAMYVVDWDSTIRSETLEVRDAATNAVLDTRQVSSFHDGQYWRWTLSGHVIIRVTATAGDNAVVSGLFFDP